MAPNDPQRTDRELLILLAKASEDLTKAAADLHQRLRDLEKAALEMRVKNIEALLRAVFGAVAVELLAILGVIGKWLIMKTP